MNRFIVYMLALGAFVTGTAELVVAGILGVIAQDLHISVALAGQTIAAYSAAFAFGAPVLISLTSRMGRKKLMLGSLILFIAGCAASCWSPDYAVLLVSRIVLGLSAGVYTVVALSSIAKLVPPSQMGAAVGTIALAFGCAMAFGVPIGIAVANVSNWRAVFALLGLVGLLAVLALARILPQVEGDAPVPFHRQFAVLGSPAVVGGLVLSLLLNTGNSIMQTYMTPYMQHILHLDVSRIAWMILVLGLFGIVGSRLGGFGVDRWGPSRMLAATLALSAASLALLPLPAVPLLAALGLIVVWFASLFMNAPALQTYFIRIAPQSSNLILGLNMSVVHLGIALGAGVGGAVAEASQAVRYIPWAACLVTASALAAALVSFSMRRRSAAKSGVSPASPS